MPLIDQVQKDLVAAMKKKDEARLSTLRMMKTVLQRHAVDSMKALDEKTEQDILRRMSKERRLAADMYRAGGRADLAEKEEAESTMIQTYLRAAASEAEIDAAINEALAETGATTAKQMGAVMKAANARLTGKNVDGKMLSERVKSRLS